MVGVEVFRRFYGTAEQLAEKVRMASESQEPSLGGFKPVVV
jgi:hypothetical protein